MNFTAVKPGEGGRQARRGRCCEIGGVPCCVPCAPGSLDASVPGGSMYVDEKDHGKHLTRSFRFSVLAFSSDSSGSEERVGKVVLRPIEHELC